MLDVGCIEHPVDVVNLRCRRRCRHGGKSEPTNMAHDLPPPSSGPQEVVQHCAVPPRLHRHMYLPCSTQSSVPTLVSCRALLCNTLKLSESVHSTTSSTPPPHLNYYSPTPCVHHSFLRPLAPPRSGRRLPIPPFHPQIHTRHPHTLPPFHIFPVRHTHLVSRRMYTPNAHVR